MPPVVNTPDKHAAKGSASSSGPHPSTIQRKSDLLCRVKWNNTLPDIPFDPKFITYPFDSDRFTKYKATSLEKEYKHDLLTEYDLGVAIDLITPEAYGPVAMPRDPDDERLLEEESTGINSTPGHHNLSEKRSRQHNKVVPWLKKTEYISNEFNRYGASSENNETKVGYNVQKKFKEVRESMICMDKDAQIAAINRTFDEAKKPITQHHSKKGVTPVQIMPVFPDFDHWKIPFAQVTFDAEPVAVSSSAEKLMCEAMIRGVMDSESGEQFVAYFLPTPETLEKRERDTENGIRYDPEVEYEYKQTREYTWSVKNKSTRGYDQNYFFVIRDDALYYNELETRVRLTKRRNKSGPATNSKLVVTHREPNDMELRTQQLREQQLKPNVDDEDNAPDQDDEEQESKKMVVNQSSRESASEKGEKKGRKRKSSASSSSSSSSSDSASGSSSSGSGSSSESDEDAAKKAKKDAEEIFGSDDSS